MLESGGGGGVVATPWYDYALPQMWGIVNGQPVDGLWQQASGWKKAIELTSLHRYNLEQYKEQLAEAWPPGRSEASKAYIAELDKLIASVQDTHDAASANYDAMVNLALAAGDAKYKLKPLYDEYQSNAQKLADHQQLVDSYNADTTGMPQPSPGPSPVPSGRQEELNNQARSIMYGISSEITTAGAALKPPPPYKPPTPHLDPQEPGGNQTGGSGTPGGGGMLVPPVIPPVRPAPVPTPVKLSPPPPPPPPPSYTPPGIGQGPILGGTPVPTPPPPPPPTTPPVIQPSPAPGPFPGLPPGPIGPTQPTYGPNTGLPSKASLPITGPINGGGAPRGPRIGGTPGTRAMPPGGVIGGQAGAGLARPAAGRPVSRVNPPGGMIGGQPGAGKGMAGVPAGRPGRRRDDEGPVQHWDPDNPWETEEGVAPVVLPPEKPKRQDPGPAIGQAR